MKRAAWSRWLRSYLSQQPASTARRPKARRLRLEDLEDRLAPATIRWDGGGATNLWKEDANWVGDKAPSAGDDLVFPGGVAKLATQNNIEGLAVNSIVFDGSGYTLTGNAIILGSPAPNTGYINSNPGSNTIAFDIQMGGVAGNRQFFTVGTATTNAGAVLTISGKLIGTTEVELSKDGQGVLVLTADNSALNSPITITQGAIRIRHKDALGDQAHRTTVLNTAPGSAQLQIDSVTGGIGEPLRLNGDGLSNSGALLNVAGDNVYTGTIVLASNSTIGANAGSLTLNGVISDETISSLTKEGAGTVILDPLNTPDGNTYRGQTFVNAGILTIHHSLALGNDPNSSQLNNTVVRSGPNKSGTLRVEYVANPARIDPYANTDPARPGFTVPFEALTLNGPGVEGIHVSPRRGNGANNITTVSGALNNASGFNTWTKDVTLWSNDSEVNGDRAFWDFAGVSAVVAIGVEGGSELVFEGHVNDDNLTPIGATTTLNKAYSLAKTKAGRAVFINQNSYRGRTEILEGFLNIRDSQALGAATIGNAGNGTFVFTGATLELQADDIPDSQSGTPVYADPPHGLPHLPTDIIITDENLRIMGDGSANTGAIRSILGVNELTGNIQLQKVYPRGNIQFTGNGASFGVEPDRAPFLQADRSQFTVSGIIADDPDGSLASGTNRRSNLTKFGGGELVLTAANTYTGVTSIRQGWVTARNSRALGGDAGSNSGTGPVSADTQQPETYIAQGAALHLKGTRTTIQVPINLPERIFVSGNGIDHRFPELNHRGAILNLSESNTISSVVTLVGTTTLPRVGLGVELDPTDPTVTTSQLTFTNLIQEGTTNPANPNGVAAVPTAGIDKLGRKRIILQGQGTYSGDNVVAEGVLRVQTDTALGFMTGTTTVNNGAALELAPYVATLHGGVANGIQVRESLVLSGPGNVTADDDSRDYTNPKLVDTLTNVSSDNIWNGPISLLTDVNLKAPLNSRLGLWDQIAGPGGFSKTGQGKLVLGGTNTYLGQTLVTAGTVNLQSGTALGSTTAGTIVSPDAAVELQGDITVAGEPLTLLGNGPDAATAVTPTWFSMGPAPLTNTAVAGAKTTGGRVTAVAADPFDPNVLYGAGADGGLWRTKNGGFTWEPLLNNPAGVGAAAAADTTFVGSVAVSPTNSRWIYVATGEANNSIDSFYGRGILRSSDYGQTWTLIQPPTPGFDRQSISKIVVDPAFEDVIYVAVQGNAANGDVATPGAGVWRFDGRPGGSGWTNLTTGQTPSGGQSTAFGATARYTDLAVINSNPWLANPNFPFEQFRRMVFITVGDPTGAGPSSTYVWNDVGNDRLGGVGPAGPNATPTTWNNMSFDTGTEDFDGRAGFRYIQFPKYGTVKVTATRPGGGTTITAYAAAAYPTSSDRVDQGTDSRFRTVFSGNSTYDITNNVWSVPGMGAMGSQPPSNPTGTAADSVFGEQAWYTSTISVSPNDANFVFLGGPGGPGTQDGPWVYNGTAWVDVNQAVGQGPAFNFHAAAWDSQGRLIVGNDGGIWRLEGSAPPAGTPTWTNLNGNFLQLGQTTGLDVNPTQVFSAVAGFNMNGTASWNDSLTWTQVDSGQGGTVFIDNRNPQVMYHAQDGNLRRSTDGGANWTTIVSGIVTPRINLTALIPPPVPYQVPGNLNSFPNTVFQGPPTGPSQGFPRVIDLNFPFVMDRETPSRILYGSRQGNGTQTPQLGDGAAVWEITGADTANPTIARLNPNTSFGSNVMSFTRAIALANRQGPWQLDPTTQTVPGFPLATDQGADSYDPNTIYVLSSDGGVWVTKNHGQLWLQRNTGLPANLNTLSDITVDPNNRDIAYVTVNAFGSPQVYRTTDAGRNWLPLATGLPDSPAWKVVVNPRNNDVYVGNDRGVYRLPGGTGTWVRFGNGMPQVQVRELVINTTTNTITAGTYGRGVFQAQLEDSRADGGGIRVVSGSSIWTGNVAVTGDLDIRAEAGSQIDFRGTIAEDPNAANPPFTINKVGLGRVVFSGTNSYAGLTNVREGQLAVRNPFALGSPGDAAKTVVFVGAALELQSNLARETVELNGNGTQFNGHYTGALRNVSNDNVFTGKLVLDTPAQGPVNNAPLPSDPASQITIGVESGSTLTIGVDTSTANPVPGSGTIVDKGPARLLTKELTGRLILNTPNTFAGELQVNQGQLQVANALALGDVAAGVRVRNGAQLELTRATNGSAITVANEALVMTGTGVNDTGALRNLAGSNTWSGSVFLRSPNDPAVIGLPAPPPATATPPFKASINVVNAADTLTLSGVISEDDPNAPPPPTPPSVGLDKIGPGRLALTRNNTYSGTTSVLAGVLSAQAANALGAPGTGAAGTVVSAGAALELFTNTAGITFAAEEVTLTGKGIAPGNLGALRNVGGNNTWTGNIVLNSTVSPKTSTPNPQIAIGVDAGTQLLVSGTDLVRDAATVPATAKAAELHKVGTGTLALGGSSTYAGLTDVESGVLNIRNGASLGGLLNDVQTIDVTGLGGTFRLNFNNAAADTGNLPASADQATIQAALEGLSTIGAGNVLVQRAVNSNFIVVTFVNALGGANQPQLTGSSTPGTAIAIATVQNGGPSAGTVVRSGATLQVQGGITVANEPLTLNGSGVNNAGALENASGNNTWSRSITLGSDSYLGVTGAGDTLTIDQSITQASANLGVTKVGPGTLAYAGGAGTGNTYTGTTKVNDGTLLLNKTGGAVAINGNLTVGDGVGGNATARLAQPNQVLDSATVRVESDGLFDLNGLAETIATLRILDGDANTRNGGVLTVGAIDMTGGKVSIGLGGQLVLNGNVTATSSALETATIDGLGVVNLNSTTPRDFTVLDGPRLVDLRIDSVVSGASGLNKRGAGLMELERVNTYAGDTTIFAGELRVDGQVGHVTLDGGTLGGEGTTAAVDGGNALTPAVGSVSPGDSDPGILHTGPNVWGPNTKFHVELENSNLGAGIGYDQLQVAGAIDLGGAKLEGLTGPTVAVGDQFTIITAGSVSNKFEQGDFVFIGGKKYSITYNADSVVIERIKADVQVTLTSSFNPSAYGQSVTFTASVTPKPDATGQPGPDVTFILDNTYTVVKTLDNGLATLDPATDIPLVLSVGAHTVKVLYNGDADFNGGEDQLLQQVNKAQTSLTTLNPQPPTQPFYGQAVVFNYLVSANRPDTAPGAQPPSGTVTVTVTNYNGPPIVLTVDPTTGRMPPLTLTGLSVGTHDVTATYSGDGNYQSAVLTKSINVVRATPNVVVSAQPPSSAFGESVHFTATVTAVYQNAGLPTGQVVFYDGEINEAKKIGQGTLTPIPGSFSGTFSFDTAKLARGSHTIIAHYLGDTNFTLTDGVLPFNVLGAATDTSLGITPSSPVFGQPVTFTATVTTELKIGTPTGKVKFVVDGIEQSPTIDLNASGKAQYSGVILAAGDHIITANFLMNDDYGQSDATQTLHVFQAATSVTVSPELNPAAANQPVTYTAVVKALPPGAGAPTGTVRFFVDGAPQPQAVPVVDGVAKLSIAIAAPGVHSVRAEFSATLSGNFKSSNSPVVSPTIVPFTSKVTLVPVNPSSVFGQPVTYTAVVRGGPYLPVGGPLTKIPTGTVTFFVNGVARQTIALTPGGGAALALNLAVGTPTVTARYNGSPAYAAGIASVQATVAKANTRTVVTSNHPTAIVGQPVTVTATVSAVAPGGGVPPGLVTFLVDGVAQTPLPLNGKGQVSLILGALPLGGHQVVAVYNEGAVSYNGSTSATFVQNVIPQPPASQLTAVLTAPPAVGSVFGIRVVARDQFGNPVANFSIPATIQLLAVPPGGALLGPRTAGFVNGVASFNGMGVTRAGRYLVRIFAGGLFTDLIIDAQGRLV